MHERPHESSGLELPKEKGKQEMSRIQCNRGKQAALGLAGRPGWGSPGRLPQGVTGEMNLKHITAQCRKVDARVRQCGMFGKCLIVHLL